MVINKYVRIVVFGKCFATSKVMKLRPGDFLLGKVDIWWSTSAGEKALGGRESCSGDSR